MAKVRVVEQKEVVTEYEVFTKQCPNSVGVVDVDMVVGGELKTVVEITPQGLKRVPLPVGSTLPLPQDEEGRIADATPVAADRYGGVEEGYKVSRPMKLVVNGVEKYFVMAQIRDKGPIEIWVTDEDGKRLPAGTVLQIRQDGNVERVGYMGDEARRGLRKDEKGYALVRDGTGGMLGEGAVMGMNVPAGPVPAAAEKSEC